VPCNSSGSISSAPCPILPIISGGLTLALLDILICNACNGLHREARALPLANCRGSVSGLSTCLLFPTRPFTYGLLNRDRGSVYSGKNCCQAQSSSGQQLSPMQYTALHVLRYLTLCLCHTAHTVLTLEPLIYPLACRSRPHKRYCSRKRAHPLNSNTALETERKKHLFASQTSKKQVCNVCSAYVAVLWHYFIGHWTIDSRTRETGSKTAVFQGREKGEQASGSADKQQQSRPPLHSQQPVVSHHKNNLCALTSFSPHPS
jgi:hypothetical protein